MIRRTRPRPEAYEPLALAPEKAKARFGKTAERAHREPMRALKLKCLDCCAWDYAEAQRCEITTCPLWALNRRIFGESGASDGGSGG